MYSSIVCLGKKACDVGEHFQVFSDCNKIKLIDLDIEGDDCYSLPKQKTAEEYEKNTPDLTGFFSDLTNDVLFIISSDNDAANSTLKILQQIKEKNIYIVYISPQKDFLTNKQFLQERVVRNVLQEYTRSGLFKQIILLDSNLIEVLMPETSVKKYDAEFNQTIVWLLRRYFLLNTDEVILDQFNAPPDVSRILTIGYYDIASDLERMGYNLALITDKVYHFFLSEQTLNGDASFLRELKNKIKNKAVDNIKVSYTVRSCNENDFCFVVYYSKLTQQ